MPHGAGDFHVEAAEKAEKSLKYRHLSSINDRTPLNREAGWRGTRTAAKTRMIPVSFIRPPHFCKLLLVQRARE